MSLAVQVGSSGIIAGVLAAAAPLGTGFVWKQNGPLTVTHRRALHRKHTARASHRPQASQIYSASAGACDGMEVVNETNKIVTVEGMGRRNIARDRQHSRLLIAEK